jgi:hypothetical protein
MGHTALIELVYAYFCKNGSFFIFQLKMATNIKLWKKGITTLEEPGNNRLCRHLNTDF